ncbi:MAG: hypothetical protein JNG89_20395 [Planctomycetaceae bacterium]|nr:hypothetical protein [Planctomycetaceae bacterium]
MPEPTENRRCHVTKVAVWLLTAAVCVFSGTLAPAQEAVEPTESDVPAETFQPRGNSEFIGRQTVARITTRFEMYDPHSVEALRTLKDMGFTQVMLDWPNLHQDATSIGLDVVLANWWTDKTPPEEIDRSLELARQVDPARLAGISVMDEPELNAPETPFGFYVDLYGQLRQRRDRELPGVRLEISHAGPRASWDQRHYDYFSFLYESADVVRIMPFPDLSEGPLSDVYFMILRSRELMKIAGAEPSLVVILQTWVLPPESKLPEIAELRVMAWQAMLGGAETLSFFDYNPEVWSQTPGFHDQFAALMNELTSVSDRLRDATIRSWMDSHGVLHAEAHWPSGHVEFITVNTNRISVCNLAPLAVVESPMYRSRTTTCPQISTPTPTQHPGRCRPSRRTHRTHCDSDRDDD